MNELKNSETLDNQVDLRLAEGMLSNAATVLEKISEANYIVSEEDVAKTKRCLEALLFLFLFVADSNDVNNLEEDVFSAIPDSIELPEGYFKQ